MSKRLHEQGVSNLHRKLIFRLLKRTLLDSSLILLTIPVMLVLRMRA